MSSTIQSGYLVVNQPSAKNQWGLNPGPHGGYLKYRYNDSTPSATKAVQLLASKNMPSNNKVPQNLDKMTEAQRDEYEADLARDLD